MTLSCFSAWLSCEYCASVKPADFRIASWVGFGARLEHRHARLPSRALDQNLASTGVSARPMTATVISGDLSSIANCCSGAAFPK